MSSFRLVALAAEQLEGAQEDVDDVEDDPGGNRRGVVGAAAAKAVEVEDRVGVEDHDACDGIDDLLGRYRGEDRDDAEGDEAEQRPEERASPRAEVAARGVS